MPHVSKKPPARKRSFVQTPFFLLYFKIRTKNFHAAKPLALLLHFLFRRDKKHYSKFTSKILEMCEQILKDSSPIQFNFLDCNKWERFNKKPFERLTPAINISNCFETEVQLI